jgi:hypothetical protein
VLAVLLVIGAGFNGASFLDFSTNISSLIMALLQGYQRQDLGP